MISVAEESEGVEWSDHGTIVVVASVEFREKKGGDGPFMFGLTRKIETPLMGVSVGIVSLIGDLCWIF